MWREDFTESNNMVDNLDGVSALVEKVAEATGATVMHVRRVRSRMLLVVPSLRPAVTCASTLAVRLCIVVAWAVAGRQRVRADLQQRHVDGCGNGTGSADRGQVPPVSGRASMRRRFQWQCSHRKRICTGAPVRTGSTADASMILLFSCASVMYMRPFIRCSLWFHVL